MIKNIVFPDSFIEHQDPNDQYEEAGMDCNSIVNLILNFFDEKVLNLNNFINKK